MERFAGRYDLLRQLGQGGMGSVWLARDGASGTECVLKRLTPDVLLVAPDSLRREFEMLARVRHPAVVSVLDMGFAPDGTPWLTMEYVPGTSADLAPRTWDTEALCAVGSQVAAGLEALHAAGVVHGDLKPSNLLLLPPREGESLPAGVRLVDFGLASLVGRDREGHRGTPGFAAPEVVRGEAPGVASDLYGLGALLYALGARRISREGVSSANAMRRQQHASPPAAALEEAGLAPPLVQLVLRLMSPLATERPADAHEVRRELERIHPVARRSLAERIAAETFVGRERELARFERWAGSSEAPARIVFVSGEPGAGKTALLSELAVRSALAGREVIRLACRDSAQPGAVAQALARRLDAAADAASAPAGPLEVEPLVELLYERLAGADGTIAPRLVLVDDCERMDALSRAALRALALDERAAALRWVWAGRREPGEDPDDERVLQAAGRASSVVLRPLDAGGSARLIAQRLQEPPPEGLAEALQRRTGGSPGLIVEALRAAVESGALREGELRLVLDLAALEALGLPPSFEASLLERLGNLAPAARIAAEALAVLDRPVTPAELAQVEPGADGDGIRALAGSGLARWDHAGRLALHPLELARRLRAGLAESRRRELHRSALGLAGLGDALRARHLEGAGEPVAALAALEAALSARPDLALALQAAALADRVASDRAAGAHARAGRLLQEQGRHREAVPHLERALEGAPEPAVRATSWVLLSSALLRADRPGDVADVVRRALAEPLPPRERALLLVNDAAQCHSRGALAEGESRAREALAAARATGDHEAVGYATLTLGAILLALGRLEEGDTCAREAIESFDAAGVATGAVRALLLRASFAQRLADRARAAALMDDALSRARAGRLRLATEEILLTHAAHAVEAGRWKEGEAALEEGARLALADGRPRGFALATANLAVLDALTGRVGRGRRRARRGLLLLRTHLPRLEPFGWRALAMACSAAGRARAAERAARRAVNVALRLGNATEAAWGRWCYGRIRALAGAWNEADAVWLAGLEKCPESDRACAALLLVHHGRAALRRRELESARTALEKAECMLQRLESPWVTSHAAQLRAELTLVSGDAGDAVECVREALLAFAALPAPADRAACALDCARMAIGAGVQAPVDEWLEQAAATFERLGDHRGRERSLALAFEWLRSARLSPSRARGRDLLRSVSRLLDSLSDLGELSRRAMALAVEQLDAERGVLLLVDDKTDALVPVVEQGAVDAATRNQAVTYSREIVARVAATGGSLLIPDAVSDPGGLSASMVDLRLRSIVCVPLYGAGKVVGAVYLDDSRRSEAFGDADRALLEGFAHLVAIAIEKSRGAEEQRRSQERLEDENRSLRREVGVRFQPQNFVGRSSAMQQVLAVAERAAQTSTTVLITGENGTGKEMVARVIHHAGRRRNGPFVAVNCGAIPEGLLESELFGILPNVATGVRGRDGRFVQAHGGTLFLDEIGDMPVAQQVALLTVLSSREVTPIGGGEPIPVDVRIVAATNQDLRRKVEEGGFREDLFYRLSVLPIEMPPLRDRKADIPALARHFTTHFAKQQEREVPELSPEFLAALMQSDWPGNVRELQNYIERVMAMTPGRVLLPRPLPRDLDARGPKPRPSRGRKLRDLLLEVERQHIHEALERAAGNQSRAARELGMTEQSLRYRLRKFGPAARKNRRTR